MEGTHEFDITLDVLLMAWNFKDILRFFSSVYYLYNFYFTHNVALTELVFSNG